MKEMSTITKPKTSIFAALGSLFSSEIDVEDSNKDLPKELDDVLIALASKEKQVGEPISNISNNSKKGGFGNKFNPNTEKAMRAMHKAVKQKSVDGREERE